MPRGEVIPIEYAVSANACGPTSSTSWANTALTDFTVASVSDIVPLPGSALLTVQGAPPPGSVSGLGELPRWYVEFGSTPCLIAVVITNVLNDEPGCRCAWAAKFNWLLPE